jgi:hypothetical protein
LYAQGTPFNAVLLKRHLTETERPKTKEAHTQQDASRSQAVFESYMPVHSTGTQSMAHQDNLRGEETPGYLPSASHYRSLQTPALYRGTAANPPRLAFIGRRFRKRLEARRQHKCPFPFLDQQATAHYLYPVLIFWLTPESIAQT